MQITVGLQLPLLGLASYAIYDNSVTGHQLVTVDKSDEHEKIQV